MSRSSRNRLSIRTAGILLAVLAAGCGSGEEASVEGNESDRTPMRASTGSPETEGYAKATFAGGCFWCMQPPYDELEGVVSTTVGYTGGQVENPTYEQVCSGTSGHAEAVEILFDPARTSYEELLDVFWRNIDPTAVNRQFADRGTQYRTAIFVHDEEQRRLAEESKREIEASGRFERVVTEIVPASVFFVAEAYHQGYYRTNPLRYNAYKEGSGRARYLRETWGDEGRSDGSE